MQVRCIAAFVRILTLLLIGSQSLMGFSDSISKIRLNLNAALLINRNFSNYPLKDASDDVSTTKYSAVPGAAKYRAGFLFGADMLFRPQEKFKMLLGMSLSHHNSEYHSSYIAELPTSRPGYTKLTRATENNYQLSVTALNFQAGMRAQLSEFFFLTTSLMLTSPLKITRVLNGYTESVYSNSSGAEERDLIVLSNEESTLEQKPANLSLNFKLEYQVMVRQVPAQIFLFKNFGLLYSLPWWGIGVSYAIIQ